MFYLNRKQLPKYSQLVEHLYKGDATASLEWFEAHKPPVLEVIDFLAHFSREGIKDIFGKKRRVGDYSVFDICPDKKPSENPELWQQLIMSYLADDKDMAAAQLGVFASDKEKTTKGLIEMMDYAHHLMWEKPRK